LAAPVRLTVHAAVVEFAITWVPLTVGRVQLTLERGMAGATVTVAV
jgi:hypothetical protein